MYNLNFIINFKYIIIYIFFKATEYKNETEYNTKQLIKYLQLFSVKISLKI